MDKIKIKFKLLPNYINQYKCQAWEVYKNDVKTFFTIEKCTKEYYNHLYEDDPTYKKDSIQSYGVYEEDGRCIDGFCDEFSTLSEAKNYIREILKEREAKQNDRT